MKIFLLNPKIQEKSIMNVRKRQPLSLGIIASELAADGHEIKFLDANAEDLVCERAIVEVNEFEPEVLILTSSPIDRWECPNTKINSVFKIIDSTKANYKVLTGSHGTTMPEWIFENCAVDFVVRGEPELTVRELIRSFKNQAHESLAGISFKRDGLVVNNPSAERITDLDSLPIAAYGMMPMDKYFYPGMETPFSIMMTSRGCPYQCVFCLKAMMAGQYAYQTPERVLKEIKHLLERFKVKSIYFQDWEFLILPTRVEKICELILENDLKFDWGCNARASDIAQNEKLVALMKQAGCKKINLGLESGSQKVLDKLNKNISLADLQKAILVLKNQGLDGGYYVLLNSPGEDRLTIKETVDFILKNGIKVKNFNPVIPYPGTALYEQLIERNPGKKITWDNIEEYAGRVDVSFSPLFARWFLRHYKYRKAFGRLYLLNPGFWLNKN